MPRTISANSPIPQPARESVVVTRNDRPVGIMISIEDAADTLIPDLFMDCRTALAMPREDV